MDAEHTLSPEATSENVIESISTEEMEALRIYFERYSQEMLTSFRLNLSSTDDLPHFLLRQLGKTKDLFSTLEQPWSRYIPILYQALALYFIHVPEQKKRQNALNLTTELISVLVNLSQSGRLISRLCAYYSNQAKMLEKYIDENK